MTTDSWQRVGSNGDITPNGFAFFTVKLAVLGVIVLPFVAGCLGQTGCDLANVFDYSVTVGNHTNKTQVTGFRIVTDSDCEVSADASRVAAGGVKSFRANALAEPLRIDLFANDGSRNLTASRMFVTEDTIGFSYAILEDRIEGSTVVE